MGYSIAIARLTLSAIAIMLIEGKAKADSSGLPLEALSLHNSSEGVSEADQKVSVILHGFPKPFTY